MMAIPKRGKVTNRNNFGFDTDADFIPFDFSDDDHDVNEVHDSRPESPGSIQTIDSLALQHLDSTNITNRIGGKRKRADLESSPERGPPQQRQKFAQTSLNPWQTDTNDYSAYKETAKILHKEVQDFLNWISPTTQEDEVRAFVVKRVIDTIESAAPQCRAFAFGSFNTKLYVPDADIDMVVNWPGHTWTNSSMRQLARQIERNGIGRNFQYIFGAKVPIIKFVDTFARIDIDLSFNQTNALNVADLVQRYLREMPAIRPLVMVLKTLFRQKHLSIPAEGGLGSYSIICMVISFLQRHPKIAAGHIIAEDNLGAMLIEILELYGTRFNFDRVGIALDNGGFYFDKIKYERINPHIWKRICVRDPNDPNNNIAKASHQSENIIKVFGDGFRELTTRCYLLHAKIKAGETAPWGTKCGSILDAIIERPQQVIVRERLKGLWRENMSEVIQQLNSQPPVDPPTPKKPNRRERRAIDKRTKNGPREKRKNDKAKNENATPAIIIPPRRRSPVTKKASTAVDSTGTRDMPILLDESSNSPSPQFATRPPMLPAKKRKGPIDGVDSAAANLQATGSISGVSRNTLQIN